MAAGHSGHTDRLGKSKTCFFGGNCSERYETWCTSLVGPAGGGFGFTSPGKALCGVGNGFEVYFALRREGEALASSSPSPSTFRRAQRPRPPSLHRRPTSSTPGMARKRPVGVRLQPHARKTTTRHVSSVSSMTEHRHPPRAHRHDRRAEIGRGTPV